MNFIYSLQSLFSPVKINSGDFNETGNKKIL